MMILVSGGSGSGKSAIAEKICMSLKTEKRYYLATMKICDEECVSRVKRHRDMRKGKNFETVETPSDLMTHTDCIKTYDSTILLECIGNLTANEQFRTNSYADVKNKIVDDIIALSKCVKNIVMVTNEVFCDICSEDIYTVEYLENIGFINRKLAACADIVIESLCGYPVILKGEGLYNEIGD